MQATSVRKDQTITQVTSRLTKMERDLKSAQTRFQEEKKLLTIREEELLKAKAEVGLSLYCNPAACRICWHFMAHSAFRSCLYIHVLYVCCPMLYLVSSPASYH